MNSTKISMSMNLNTLEDDYSETRSIKEHAEEQAPLIEAQTSTFTFGKNTILSFLGLLISLSFTFVVCLLFYYNTFASWNLLFRCGAILGWIFTLPFIVSMISLLTWNSYFVSKLAKSLRKSTITVQKDVEQGVDFGSSGSFSISNQLNLKKSIKQIVKIVALVLVTIVGAAGIIFLLLASIVWGYILNNSISDRESSLNYSELKEDVIIKRDTSSGLIHIIAKNDEDLFFAQGVVAAQERLWQLEFNKRIGRGTLSEIIGNVDQVTSIDKLIRTLGFYRSAQNDWPTISNTDPMTKMMIEQFVKGINSYVQSKHVQKPLEALLFGVKFDEWRPEDVFTWIKLMSWDLSPNAAYEINRFKLLLNGETLERVKKLIPFFDINEDSPTVLSRKDLGIDHLTPEEIKAIEDRLRNEDGTYVPQPNYQQDLSKKSISERISFFSSDGRASNNWVIGPNLTYTKKPLLCNDPHLKLTSPSIWYLVHIHSPTFDAVGAALPSVPGVVIGRNKDISWGVTNSFADVQDLFVIDEIDENHYLHPSCPDNSCPYNFIEERIKVKGGDDIVLKIKDTIYGPAINDIYNIKYNKPIAFWWTTLRLNDTTIISFTHLLKSQNWEDFKAAMKFYVSPAQNFIYADNEGNIGYIMPGKIPVRKVGHTGRFPVAGNGQWDYIPTKENPTGDFIPFDKLPQVYNPSKGYVVSANFRIPPLGYEYVIAFDHATPYRAARIVQLVEQNAYNHTVETMKAIQMDTLSLLYKKFQFMWNDTEILALLSSEYHSYWNILTKWDGNENWGSQPATLFEGFLKNLEKLPMKKYGYKVNYGTYQWLISALQDPIVDPACEEYRSCRRFAVKSFIDTVDTIKGMKGGEIPMWGVDVHDTNFGHALFDSTPLKCIASRTIRNIGGTMTVNVNDNNGLPNFVSTEGVSYRQIVSWDNVDENSLFINGPGQSGNMFEGSYDSMLEMWRKGEYIHMTTNSDKIHAQTQRLKSTQSS